MPHIIGFLLNSPVAGPAVFLSGLTFGLCGYLGHTRPVRSALFSFFVLLLILLFLCFLWFGIATGEAGDFAAAFLAPFTAVLGLAAPVTVLWFHLRLANKKMKATRVISKWLRPFVFAVGILLIFLSLPGLFKYLAWFI